MVNGDYHCFCLFVFLGNGELMCLKTEGWKYDQKYRTIKKTNMESDYKKEKKKKANRTPRNKKL